MAGTVTVSTPGGDISGPIEGHRAGAKQIADADQRRPVIVWRRADGRRPAIQRHIWLRAGYAPGKSRHFRAVSWRHLKNNTFPSPYLNLQGGRHDGLN